MQRARRTTESNRAGATRVALAFFCGALAGGGAHAQEEPAPPVGMLSLGEAPSRAQAELRRVVAGALVWLGWDESNKWAGVIGALGGTEGATWSVGVPESSGLTLRPVESGDRAAGVFPFDLSFDCNQFRDQSPHPFSRTVRGRVLDALQIDNARTSRLSIVPSQDEEHPGRQSLVLFSQSRGEAPGAWHAVQLAAIEDAPTRDEAAAQGRPVELDFGEGRVGVAMAIADLVLATDPASESISARERFEAWGLTKTAAVDRLARALDGRVWLWSAGAGVSADGSAVVAAFPLVRSSADRDVARTLGTLFARRLVWTRDPTGRATATLALKADNSPPAEGERTLSMRFVTIVNRVTLVVSTEASALDGAVTELAEIPPVR